MKKQKNWINLMIIICFFIIGLVFFQRAFDVLITSVLTEHDKQFLDLMESVDMNLNHRLHRVRDEFQYVVDSNEIRDAEMQLKNGDTERMLYELQNSVIYSDKDVKNILVYHNDDLLLCSEGDKDCKFTFLDEEDQDRIFVCIDEKKKAYLAIKRDSKNEDYVYYALMETDHLYDNIVPKLLMKDNWVVFYDVETGFLTQNHNNQPSYQILSKEEIRKRNDGYTILLDSQEKNEPVIETYKYKNLDSVIVNQRIATLPVSHTVNGSFAIAVAHDSRMIYEVLKQVQNQMILASFFILLAFVFIIWKVIGLRNYRKEVEYNMKMVVLENEYKEKVSKAQIQNSVSQMQPHFLYNALSSIREIVMDDPEYASDLIYDFTTHLRSCIRSLSHMDYISFTEELANIQAYVNIEKLRFGDKLSVVYDITFTDFKIAPLTIQPLVENAIRHGIFKRGRQGGMVTISSQKLETGILICVKDTGVGFDYEELKKDLADGKRDSIGLDNVVFRLRYMMKAEVEINSEIGVGTEIRVMIPFDVG